MLLKISMKTGNVVAWYNLAKLNSQLPNERAVLQGVAFDTQKKLVYVTGKFWPKIYIIQPHHR